MTEALTSDESIDQVTRGNNGEYVWDERTTETRVILTEEGAEDIIDLGIPIEKLLYSIAIQGGVRQMSETKTTDDPKFIVSIAQAESEGDSEKATKIFDTIQSLISNQFLVVEYHGE